MLRTLATDLTGAGTSAECWRFRMGVGQRLRASCCRRRSWSSFEFVLQDAREEFTFSDQGLLTVRGDSAATTRRVIERFNYKSHILAHMRFETAGHVDHDCELQFVVGDRKVSIDVARTDEQ